MSSPQELLTTFPIPKIYWDSLQAALQGQIKRFARDVAASLKQNEYPLLKAIAQEKVGAYLFDEEGQEFKDCQSMRCQHLIPSSENASVLQSCNQPILLGQRTTGCPYHVNAKLAQTSHLPLYRRVKNGEEILWVNESNLLIRPSDLKPVGVLKDGGTLLLLEMDG